MTATTTKDGVLVTVELLDVVNDTDVYYSKTVFTMPYVTALTDETVKQYIESECQQAVDNIYSDDYRDEYASLVDTLLDGIAQGKKYIPANPLTLYVNFSPIAIYNGV